MVYIILSFRNNAGKFSQKLEFSEDKFEMTFATNYLGNLLIQVLFIYLIVSQINIFQ